MSRSSRIEKGKGTPSWVLPFLYLTTGGAVLSALQRVLSRVLCPFQVNQSEAANAEVARLLGSGILPYPDLATDLSMFSLYPPLYSFLTGSLMRIIPAVFFPGRLIALLAFLGCAVLLWGWGRKRWGRSSADMALFLFLLFPAWRTWGSQVRPDTLAILLSFTGLLLLLRREEGTSGTSRDFRAGILCGAALLVKQTAIVVPLALTIQALVDRDLRRWGIFVAGMAVIFLPATLVLQTLTQGRYLDLLTRGVAHGFDVGLWTRSMIAWFLPESGWLFIAGGMAVLTRRVPLLPVLTAALSLFWVLGLARPGAAGNYLMEFELYSLFLIGESLVAPRRGAGPTLAVPGRMLLGLWAAGLVSLLLVSTGPTLPSKGERDAKREALAFYAGDGDHLAVDADLPLMAGKPLFLPPAEYTLMAQAGLLSTEPLKQALRDRRFKTVEVYSMPRQYLLPEDVVEEVKRHYRVHHQAHGRLWLVPKEGGS